MGYTIKYPADKFIDCSLGDNFALHHKSSNDTICAAGEGIPNLSIAVFDKNKEAAESRFSECYSTKQEMVKIGDITGTKYANTRNTNDACNTTEIAYARSKSYILINHGGAIFQVVLDEFSNQELKITQVVDQILSTFKFTDQNQKTTISPSKNKVIPSDIQSTLPIKSSDGKDINPYYISDDPNYIIFGTFVKYRGAGKENNWWLLNRSTKEQINLSTFIKNDTNYLKTYQSKDINTLFLTFYDRWVGNNPVFTVADGWQEVGVGSGTDLSYFFWEYDINSNKFISIPNQ